MNNEEQQFLADLDKRLWNAANRLRANVNPSDCMQVVLGLVFLKYISDAFNERRTELEAAFRDPADDYFLGEFSIAAGKRGGEFYTPKSIVALIVRTLTCAPTSSWPTHSST